MLIGGNVKLALKTLRAARWRSTLTMLGIIIGVASVVVTVSLGEGVRKQVEGQIRHLGNDVITIRAGKTNTSSTTGIIKSINLQTSVGNSGLSEKDYAAVKSSNGVKQAIPFALINASPKTDERELSNAFVIGTTAGVPELLNQNVRFGEYFTADEINKKIAVIGHRVAEDLFGENVPIGKSMYLRGERYIVSGIFDQFESSPLSPYADYNNAIFIPLNSAKQINNDQIFIYQVLAKSKDPAQTNVIANNIKANMLIEHGGQEDFSVLKQDENLAVSNAILNLMTGLIAGIAAISLVVGGIGIMNIMLVSVIERTGEIGVRKAVGATNSQILGQFITESAVLSLAGGIIGIILSLLIGYLVRVFTDIKPAVTWPIMLIALGLALVVGIFFGIAPALKAARKDPIEALRHE